MCYLAGVVSVSRRRGRRWPRWRTASFLAGLGVCLLATSSSIAVYDMVMFSAHMLGHLALVMVAPPLLAAGRPMTLALHAVGNPWHRRLRGLVRSRALGLWFCPPVALASYAVVIVGTHLTGLMGVIMAHPWAGQLEHLVYVVVGYQFFALVVGGDPVRWRLSMPAKELLLAVAMAVDTFTGVILLQSSQAISMAGPSPPHLDPLADTRLGGAIMWVGGDAIMAVIMVIVALAWLRLPERRRRESRSWLEQARRDTFVTHTSGIDRTDEVGDVDTDERARDAYNAWLKRLDRTP
jgi:putative copper resistance protein D